MIQNDIDNLRKAGQALYGDRWQTNLSRALNLSDPVRIRQWLSNSRPIPKGIWTDIAQLLRDRKVLLDGVLLQILKDHDLNL